MQTTFKTTNGETYSGDALTNAFNTVADTMEANAYAIRQDDSYASHVTEEEKDNNLSRSLEYANRVRNGYIDSLAVWQAINQELTGECVALLP